MLTYASFGERQTFRQAEKAISSRVRRLVLDRLNAWHGERMPISRAWVENELTGLEGDDYQVAKLILIVAKASFQVDDSLVQAVLGENQFQERLIRVLAFASLSAARRLARHYGRHLSAGTAAEGQSVKLDHDSHS